MPLCCGKTTSAADSAEQPVSGVTLVSEPAHIWSACFEEVQRQNQWEKENKHTNKTTLPTGCVCEVKGSGSEIWQDLREQKEQ